MQDTCASSSSSVHQVGTNINDCLLFAHFRIGNKQAATGHLIRFQFICDVQFVRNNHVHIPIDATIIIEIQAVLRFAWRSQRIMFGRHTESYHIIIIPPNEIRYIRSKSHIASSMFRHLLTVDEQFASIHHPFERDCNTLATILLWQMEIAPVPSYPIINGISSAMFLFQLHDVRQCCRHPVRDIQFREFSSLYVTPIKCPIRIHIELDSGRFLSAICAILKN